MVLENNQINIFKNIKIKLIRINMVEISNIITNNNINIKSLKNVAFKMCKEYNTFDEYVKFLEERIQIETDFFSETNIQKTYRYKDLNSDQVTYLKKFFKRIETERDNKDTKHYEDILFKKKQKKNYNEKKNNLIDEWRTKKIDELDKVPKNEKSQFIRAKLFNEIYMYNFLVPQTYSKESLRKVVLNQ